MPYTSTTSCPGHLVGRILGKGKAHLTKLETDYEVKVTLLKERSSFQTFQVEGEMNNVRTAIMDINNRVSGLQEWQARRKHNREINHIKNKKTNENADVGSKNVEVVSKKSVFDAFNEIDDETVVDIGNVESVIEDQKAEAERLQKQKERETRRAKKRGIKVDASEVLYIKGRTGDLKRENWLRRQEREKMQNYAQNSNEFVPQELPDTASWWN